MHTLTGANTHRGLHSCKLHTYLHTWNGKRTKSSYHSTEKIKISLKNKNKNKTSKLLISEMRNWTPWPLKGQQGKISVHLYAIKFDNTHNISWLTKSVKIRKRNLNRPGFTKEMEQVINSLSKKKATGLGEFTSKLHQECSVIFNKRTKAMQWRSF